MGLNITGRKFNKLTAVRFSHKEGEQKRAKWLFKCDCGNNKILDKGKVTGNYTKSCGCLMIAEQERFTRNATTHGLSGGRKNKKPEYNTWSAMKRRCFNEKDLAYKYYGARGIIVCERWNKSFKDFFNDVGKRPSNKYSIDRINNNGNYEPLNCRWATPLQQGRNRRNLKLITIDNKTKCITEWVEHLGLNQNEVNRNLYERKLPIGKALNIALCNKDKIKK